MDLHRLVKDGLSWFLITANSVILFMSINSLDNLAASQANVVKAFESSSEALSNNANSIVLGVSALDEFGLCLAASVDSAADAFGVFEGVIDRHIELARIQAEVVKRQGRYLQDFTEGLLKLKHGKEEANLSFGDDSADDLEDIYGINREDGLNLIEELNKIDDEYYELIKPPLLEHPSHRPSIEISRTSACNPIGIVDDAVEPTYDREDFTFGEIPYEMTKKLSVLCCLYKLTVQAYAEEDVSLDLFYDIINVLEDLAQTEADRLGAELESAGWVLVRRKDNKILT